MFVLSSFLFCHIQIIQILQNLPVAFKTVKYTIHYMIHKKLLMQNEGAHVTWRLCLVQLFPGELKGREKQQSIVEGQTLEWTHVWQKNE